MTYVLSINDRMALIANLKAELGKRLAEVQAPLTAHREAASVLRGMGLEAGNINTYSAFTAVIAAFLRHVEQTLTRAHQGTGSANVELGGTRDDFEFRQFRAGEMNGQTRSLEEQAASLMALYPFERLADEAIRQSKDLEAKGLADIANRLGNHLGLFVGFYNKQEPFLPFKSGRMVCHFGLTKSFMGNEYNRTVIEGLERMARNLTAVECEMGVSGMSQSIERIAQTLSEGLQPSRSKLNQGAPVEAVVFNEHMHLKFAAEVADALLAFVTLHKTRELDVMGLRGVAA